MEFQIPAYQWAPRADQLAHWKRMIRPDFRLGVMACHRRWGKDELGLQLTAVKAMSRVGSYWYALPEYEQARKAIWEMVNWRTKRTRVDDAFPPEIVTRKDNEAMKLWLTSGSTVQLVGSDRVDSLVGGGQIGVVVSEAALAQSSFDLFIQPILEESNGWKLELSTPRGKNHFHKALLAAFEDQRAGMPGVLAAHVRADSTSVFSTAQLLKVKMDLIRKHGHVIGNAIFDQEYMVSFEAAVVGAVWGAELTQLQLEGRSRPLPHDRRYPVSTSWDIGVGDPTVILFWQEVNGRYRLIDGFQSNDLGLDTYVQLLRTWHAEKGYQYNAHYGPHDINQREWARGVSRKDEAKRMGLVFKATPTTRVKTQLACAAQLLGLVEVNSESAGAVEAFEHFKGYHYPKIQSSGVQITVPVHDEHSHASSALCTMAVQMASKLGLGGAVADDALQADVSLGPDGKFDPRQYGPAPYSNDAWSAPHRPAPSAGTAFG